MALRTVYCVCCREILAEAHEGPYLAICSGCVDHERDCRSFEEEVVESNRNVGENPMRVAT